MYRVSCHKAVVGTEAGMAAKRRYRSPPTWLVLLQLLCSQQGMSIRPAPLDEQLDDAKFQTPYWAALPPACRDWGCEMFHPSTRLWQSLISEKCGAVRAECAATLQQ
eukprot:2059210-Amphidinium_carterae.1